MNLFSYNKYVNEAKLTPEEIEARKKAAMASHMRMYISRNLANILKKMESPIARDLIYLSRKNKRYDITYMDVDFTDGKPGMVTYLQTSKIKKLKEENNLDLEKDRSNYNSIIWKSPQRVQPTKINKVIGKLFDTYTKAEIEKFGNEFKAKSEDKDDKMRVVFGEDINKWYLETNYKGGGGSLNGSCMRYNYKNHYMNFYSINSPVDGDKGDISKFKPKVKGYEGVKPPYLSYIGMLILLDDDNKLLGRAIVWFNAIKPEGRIFMDRIYTVNDHDIDRFKEYAKKRGWLYKNKQTYSDTSYIDPKDGSRHTMTLSFRVQNKKYDNYPYMDTISFFTPETGRVSSQAPKKHKWDTYSCRSTSGGSERIG